MKKSMIQLSLITTLMASAGLAVADDHKAGASAGAKAGVSVGVGGLSLDAKAEAKAKAEGKADTHSMKEGAVEHGKDGMDHGKKQMDHGKAEMTKQKDKAADKGKATKAKGLEMVNGEVRRVDEAKGKVMLKHEEIKSLEMPPMTMMFTAENAGMVKGLKKGDKVKFAVNADMKISVIEKQ